MNKISVKITGSGPVLEGYLELPDLPPPLPAVLLCHPHPLYGGNMSNNVVMSVGSKLNEDGFAVLRFNFRGVGRSEGFFDDGVGEVEDARAALAFLSEREEIDPGRLGILGYSYGGKIGFSMGVREERAKVLAGVSPIHVPGVLMGCSKPKLIICGTDDDVIDLPSIIQEVEQAGGPETLNLEMKIIDGADHFWWGDEKQLGELAAGFFARFL